MPSKIKPKTRTRAPRAIPFDQLPSKAAKRRAICVDAIAQLKAGVITAQCGVFVGLPASAFPGDSSLNDVVEATPDLTVKTLLANREIKHCDACALGALMMGQFRVNGDCKLADLELGNGYEGNGYEGSSYGGSPKLYPFKPDAEDANGNSVFSPFVLRYFSVAQLQLIEVAFEGGGGAFSCWSSVDDWREYGDGDSFKSEAQRESWLFTMQQASDAIAFGDRFVGDKQRLMAILQSVIDHPTALFAPGK